MILYMPAVGAPIIPDIDLEERSRLAEAAHMEFVDGQALERPSSLGSSRATSQISYLLSQYADRTGQAEVYAGTLAYQCFSDDPTKFRMPDISAIRVDHLTGIKRDI